MKWFFVGLFAVIVVVAIHDRVQRKRAIIRNFPVIGHLRYLLEAVGPELRQYIVTDNDSERPFSRDQRRWIYDSADRVDNTFGFGTDNRFEASGEYLIVRHAAFPLAEPPSPSMPMAQPHDAARITLGATHGRARAFTPASFVNISGMSFGSLGARAVEALNRGAAAAGCWQSTGEAGLSPHHLHGGDLVLQVGTAYFGCRTESGEFDLGRLGAAIDQHPQIRAVEIKMSQGAKAGLGGLLPAAKVTPEIAAARGIPVGKDCHSPPAHTAFTGVEGLCEFVERIAERTGLPVGIKSAVGEEQFWRDLAARMAIEGIGPDFVVVDGGEGGTGAAPLVFADHVALPFFPAFVKVRSHFAEHGLVDQIGFIGSGRLGLVARASAAMALGVDIIAVAREAMLSIGCIQAQRCQTDRCPAGVTTQSTYLQRGLDPTLKSTRLANYIATLRYEVSRIGRACGHEHPSLLAPDDIGYLANGVRFTPLGEFYGVDEASGRA